MIALSDQEIDAIFCYAQLIILLLIAILYLWLNRKNIVYFLKNRQLAPEHQGRICPACSSEDLTLMKNGSVRCDECGVIFASAKQLTMKKDKKT